MLQDHSSNVLELPEDEMEVARAKWEKTSSVAKSMGTQWGKQTHCLVSESLSPGLFAFFSLSIPGQRKQGAAFSSSRRALRLCQKNVNSNIQFQDEHDWPLILVKGALETVPMSPTLSRLLWNHGTSIMIFGTLHIYHWPPGREHGHRPSIISPIRTASHWATSSLNTPAAITTFGRIDGPH